MSNATTTTDVCTRPGCHRQVDRQPHDFRYDDPSRPHLIALARGWSEDMGRHPQAKPAWQVSLAAQDDEPWQLSLRMVGDLWPANTPNRLFEMPSTLELPYGEELTDILIIARELKDQLNARCLSSGPRIASKLCREASDRILPIEDEIRPEIAAMRRARKSA